MLRDINPPPKLAVWQSRNLQVYRLIARNPHEYKLTCLAASAVLCLALPLVYVAMYQKQVGFPVVSGNREDAPGPTGAAGRGLRAHRNLIENLVPFAIAVMLARAASRGLPRRDRSLIHAANEYAKRKILTRGCNVVNSILELTIDHGARGSAAETLS